MFRNVYKRKYQPEDIPPFLPGKVRSFNLGKLISFDTETKRYVTDYGERQELYLADFYDGERHYTCYSQEEIYETIYLLKKKYKQITIIAHNFVKFDARISSLISNVTIDKELCGLYLTRYYWNKGIFFARFASGSTSKKFKTKSRGNAYFIQLLDTMNYFPVKLRDLVNTVQKSKFAGEEDYEQEPEKWNEFIEKKGRVLIWQDTEGLYDFFEAFLNQEGIVIGVTLADTALRTFKKHYLKQSIEIPYYVTLLAMKAYRGGRTEPYRIVKSEFLYDYDINSLYPFVMTKHKYSVKFLGEVEKPDIEAIMAEIRKESYNYLLQVDFKIDDILRSPIVYKDQRKPIQAQKLIQITEGKEIWLTGREVLSLYDLGSYIEIKRALKFENADIFSEYVKDFYERKKNAKSEVERLVSKTLMNSLCGKFAQAGQITIQHDKSEFSEIELLAIKRNVERGDQTFTLNGKETYFAYGDLKNERYYILSNEKQEPKYPAILSVEITANARLENYEIQKKIGFEHCFYTDTDSFFTDLDPDVMKEMIGEELGDLKLENCGPTNIVTSKDYQILRTCWLKYETEIGLPIDKKHFVIVEPVLIKNKGVPKNAIYDPETKEWRYDQWEGGLKSRGRLDEIRIKKRKKKLKRKADKLVYLDEIGGIPIDEAERIDESLKEPVELIKKAFKI